MEIFNILKNRMILHDRSEVHSAHGNYYADICRKHDMKDSLFPAASFSEENRRNTECVTAGIYTREAIFFARAMMVSMGGFPMERGRRVASEIYRLSGRRGECREVFSFSVRGSMPPG